MKNKHPSKRIVQIENTFKEWLKDSQTGTTSWSGQGGGGGGISKRKKDTKGWANERHWMGQSYSERENCCTYEKERIVNMTAMKKDQGGV